MVLAYTDYLDLTVSFDFRDASERFIAAANAFCEAAYEDTRFADWVVSTPTGECIKGRAADFARLELRTLPRLVLPEAVVDKIGNGPRSQFAWLAALALGQRHDITIDSAAVELASMYSRHQVPLIIWSAGDDAYRGVVRCLEILLMEADISNSFVQLLSEVFIIVAIERGSGEKLPYKSRIVETLDNSVYIS
jgi:hypothetical protein